MQSYHPKIFYAPGKWNVISDIISKPTYENDDFVRDLNAVSIVLSYPRLKDIRDEQMKGENVKRLYTVLKVVKK